MKQKEQLSTKPTRWKGSGSRKYPNRGMSPGRSSPVDCAHCGLSCSPSGDDPCIENLPNVMNACCGHGKPEDAYVQFSPTHWVGGTEALAIMQGMKAADPMGVVEDAAENGWVFLHNARKVHYFFEGRSLCGRWGYLGSTFLSDTPPYEDTCKACAQRLRSVLAK